MTEKKIKPLLTLLSLMLLIGITKAQESINSSGVIADTLIAGNYTLTFENTDSFPKNNAYEDEDYRYELTKNIDDLDEANKKLQSYLQAKFGQYFIFANNSLALKIENGTIKTFTNISFEDYNIEGVRFNFENYYSSIDYYLIHVNLWEGGYYLLVNRKNGYSTEINGLPYISKDKKQILTINTDLIAEYTVNGFELFNVLEDSLQRVFDKTTEWGPSNVKWISENQFLLKREHLNLENGSTSFDFKLVTIEKNRPVNNILIRNKRSSITPASNSIQDQTVTIGSQVWTSKNLNVVTYRNGDVIPQVQDKVAWSKLTTGAWCYYNNDVSNGTKYGKLYNWYAVNDPRGLAPNGYHIPTDAEWTKLTDYLGERSEASIKMKSTSGWYKNGNGTNSSGFSGLPGGFRSFYGAFYYVGYNGVWWSSSDSDADNAWYYYLYHYYGYGNALRTSSSKQLGFSVRCLRD